ncbi:hypothetical protein CcCBS67573_g09956 [Chytriomyces confervae]|uniref:Uncharacterized protein n=1 Tax=Chytriomyces confervae TaxID=246404 RepID=A0A507DK77_9FUNG|nr:hypothetical protein CcCBS67573_g09956 [Chytriomyces confervae]
MTICGNAAVLDRIDLFVGVSWIVYWASANAIDFNRLVDFYSQHQQSHPVKWFNAGYNLTCHVFSYKEGQCAVLAPTNYEQDTIYRHLWLIDQSIKERVKYVSDLEMKLRRFPHVNWNFETFHQKKLWVDVLFMYDIVTVFKCIMGSIAAGIVDSVDSVDSF